jgi:hypothetical protein
MSDEHGVDPTGEECDDIRTTRGQTPPVDDAILVRTLSMLYNCDEIENSLINSHPFLHRIVPWRIGFTAREDQRLFQ